MHGGETMLLKDRQYVVDIVDIGQGGVGIGKLDGIEDVCELQKMYCLEEARGTGAAHNLMQKCLLYAKDYYKKCYIETFGNMTAANKFYRKYDFQRLDKPFLETEHFSCDVWYIKDLQRRIIMQFETKNLLSLQK